MLYKKYFISLIIIFLSHISYGQESIKDFLKYEENNPYKDYFFSQLTQNKLMDYDSRTNLILNSPCWEQGVLDTTFFVLLFNYFLIDKGYEDFSEELGFRLYVFFTKYPYSILQLNYFINLMEKTYQKRLFEKILSDLFYETVVRNEQNENETKLSEIDFFRIFPYFFSNDNFICIHNIIENYYE